MAQSAIEVISRLMQAYGVHDEGALAIHLGRDRHTIRVWVSRDQVPLLILSEASRATGYSVEWLRGDEGAEPSPGGRTPDQEARVLLNPRELELIQRYRATTDQGRSAVEVVTSTLAGPAGKAPRGRPRRGAQSPERGPDPTEEGSTDAAAALVVTAREAAPVWRDGPVNTDTTRPGDGAAPPGVALLPISSAGAARPLVLSLYARGPGGETTDYELIPKFMIPAGAGRAVKSGNGAGLDQVGDMAFSFDWLRDNLGHTSGQLASIKVQGDSMAGTLMDGETIIIDTAVKRVDVSGIYVITHHGDRLVKRIDRKLDGSLVIISDNPRYSPDVLARGQAGEIEVMGRMVWPRVR